MKKGLLLVISGPSGAGKGTVLKELFSAYENFSYSVSVTTRAPRPGEVDGKDYFFKSYDEYKEILHNDGFIETAEVYGNYYGTPRSNVEKLLLEGKDVVLEIDTQGALNVKRKFPDAVSVFIIPPTIEQLRKRLTERRTESPEQLKLRLESALLEIKTIKSYDYVVVNDDPKSAAEKINAIVRANYCSISRNDSIVNNFLGGNL